MTASWSGRHVGAMAVLRVVQELDARPRAALARRLHTLLEVLTGTTAVELPDAVDAVDELVGAQPDVMWLARSVLGGRLPTDEEMDEALLTARLRGTWAALLPGVADLSSAPRLPDVEVLRGVVTCDVHVTSQSNYLSGIQRVVRETATRWHRTKDVEFLAWTGSHDALRRLRPMEHWRLFAEDPARPDTRGGGTAIVPWESTHLSPEILHPGYSGRVLALAQYSRNQVGVLGYDSIPVTSAVTVAEGMVTAFTQSLAAVRRADRVAMISAAAAEEFRGVLAMGSGRRDRGPDVAAVTLPVEAPESTPADLSEAEAGLIAPGLPMVLVVGSHEPRKNHLAVLHAAELLWRAGIRFTLVMVGAGSWSAEEYDRVVADLLAAGRPVQSIRALPDRLLWAAYRLAHCTVFPSLNEGYGLPVAESLAAGTPVVTSNVGSMRDIVAPGGEPLGGLLVDPRDDDSLIAALRTMLTDAAVHERLVAETGRHPRRSWDDYAEQVWSYLVDGERPSGGPNARATAASGQPGREP